MDDIIYTFIIGLIVIHLGIRWHSRKNHWYIFASGLACVAVSFVWEKLGLETTAPGTAPSVMYPMHPEVNGAFVESDLFLFGFLFILGCLGAILFGFLEKYCGPEDPRK